MKKIAQDAWVQLFAFLTVITAAFAFLAPAPNAIPAPAPAPVAAPAAPAAPAAQTPAAFSNSLAAALAASSARAGSPPPAGGGGLSVSGPGVVRILTPKTPGRWIVDASSAPDSDTASVDEAVGNAKDKDVIVVRPGTYPVEIATDQKTLTIEGSPVLKSKTILEAKSRVAVSISGGEMILRHLTVRSVKSDYGSGIEANLGRVELDDVVMELGNHVTGARLTSAVLAARRADFIGGYSAADAQNASKASFDLCSMKGQQTAVGAGDRSEIILSSTAISDGNMGIYGRARASIKATDVSFSGLESNAMLIVDSGSSAEMTRVLVSDARDGLHAYEGAQVTVKGSTFTAIRGQAVQSSERGSKATVQGSVFAGSKTALRAIGHSNLDDSGSVVRGSDRYGVEADNGSTVTLTGTLLEDNSGSAVFVHRQASAELTRVVVRRSGDSGVFVGDSSSARFERVRVADGIKWGVALGLDAKLDAADSEISGNRRCGIAVTGESAAVALSGAKITGNECAVSFVEGGRVASRNGDFLGNRKGAFMFLDKNKQKIALTGTGNKTK